MEPLFTENFGGNRKYVFDFVGSFFSIFSLAMSAPTVIIFLVRLSNQCVNHTFKS